MNNKIKTLIKLILGTFILSIVIYFVGIENIHDKLLEFNLLYAFLGVLTLPIAFALSGINSFLLVKAVGFSIKLKRMMVYSLMSWAYGLFAPFQLGEFILVHYVKKEGMPYGKGAVIVLLDRIITFCFLFVISCIGIILFLDLKYLFILLISFAILAVLFWLLLITNRGRSFLRKYIFRKYSAKLKGFSKTLFFVIKERKAYLAANCLITAVKWTAAILWLMILFYALGLTPNFMYVYLITCTVKILSFLPISINGIGVDETFSVLFYQLMGIPAASVLVIYLFSRIVNYTLASCLLIFEAPIMGCLLKRDISRKIKKVRDAKIF